MNTFPRAVSSTKAYTVLFRSESTCVSPSGAAVSGHTQETERKAAAELLAAVDAGDRSAWSELVGRYDRLVRSTIGSFRLQEADATDAIQTTWLRLLTNRAAIRDPERMGGWLATTARREAIAVISRSAPEIASEHVGNEDPAPDPTPEEAVIIGEQRAAVRGAVDKLTGRQKILAQTMFYRPRCSYTELSQRTGIPVGSIGPTRGRMLRELRRNLYGRPPILRRSDSITATHL